MRHPSIFISLNKNILKIHLRFLSFNLKKELEVKDDNARLIKFQSIINFSGRFDFLRRFLAQSRKIHTQKGL
jgi:hypothetical protein